MLFAELLHEVVRQAHAQSIKVCLTWKNSYSKNIVAGYLITINEKLMFLPTCHNIFMHTLSLIFQIFSQFVDIVFFFNAFGEGQVTENLKTHSKVVKTLVLVASDWELYLFLFCYVYIMAFISWPFFYPILQHI